MTALIGPSGCGKTTFLRSLNRMNDSVPGFRIEGQILYHGHDIYGATSTRSRCGGGSGWSSRNRTPSRSRSSTTSPGRRATSACAGPRRAGREGAARGGPLGRGQGPAEGQRPRPLRRPAAAPLHRPRDRDRTRRPAPRRARLGARPDRHRRDRGPDAQPQRPLHDRHRHPQHAAGGPRRRPHRLLQPRVQRRERDRDPDRVRRDRRRSSASRATRGPATTSPAASAERAPARGQRRRIASPETC